MKLKPNKKTCLIIITTIIVAILLLLAICLLVTKENQNKDEVNGLKIEYSKGKLISFNKFNKNFKEERKITVENNTKENKTYSLEWIELTNELKEQSNFVYEIKCEGDRGATLNKTGVPGSDTVVFPQCLIESGKKQEFTIIFENKGSENEAKFSGILQINKDEVALKE